MKLKNKMLTMLLVSLVFGSSVLPSISSVALAETTITNEEKSNNVLDSEEIIPAESPTQEEIEESSEEQTNETTEIVENDSTRMETMQAVLNSSTTIEAFINEISGTSMELALTNDLYSSVMIAQAILESKYGQSELGIPPVHNLFGIKGIYNGQYVLKETTEYSNGKSTLVQAKFRKYPSYKESLGDYVNKLKNGPGSENGTNWNSLYYSGAWRSNTTSYKDATKFLVNRYASDPLYNQKLDNLIETYQLTKFDTSSPAKIVPEVATELPTILFVDTLSNGAELKSEQKISGWVLSSNPVNKIEVFIDNNVVGAANIGEARADVGKAYPQYKNNNAGFSYTLPTENLSEGQHSVLIRMTNSKGTTEQKFTMNKSKVPRTIPIPNLPNYLIVDTVTNGMSLKDGHIIYGWTLSQQKSAKVEILVDDKILGNASIGIERLDVFRAYPQYANKHAGYQYKLDLTKVTEGKHTLTVRSYDTNGVKQEKKFTVEKPAIKMISYLDSPIANEKIHGTHKIRGWSLSSEKIASISVLVDGKSMGNATLGIARVDVYKVYPQFNSTTSGYEFNLDTTKLNAGTHTIVVETKTISGKRQQVKTTFKTEALSYKNSLDSPQQNAYISKDQVIRGWVLNGSAVKSIEVSINGSKVGNAQINLSRPDVAKVYPQYSNQKSGFQYQLANQNLLVGSNQVNLKITFMDGTQKNITRNVTYKKNLLPVRGVLDEPNGNSGIETTSINVKGWFLAEEGIDKVEIYVDGVYKGRANYGQVRTDVNKVYPEYKNSHSGFNLSVDSRSLSVGKHVVKAVATTSLNAVITTERTFTKGSLSGKKIYLDAGHGGKDPGAVSVGVQEKVLNLKVALKVQALLVSQGAEVVMSRTGDQFIPLNEISTRANASQADIFVSLHHNSATEAAYGIETYSYGASNTRSSRSFSLPSIDLKEQNFSTDQKALNEVQALNSTFSSLAASERLSKNIQSGLISSTGAYDRGAKKNDFHVVRETNMEAVLVELGFITNPSERAKLVTDSYQNKLANGILNGIKVYFSK